MQFTKIPANTFKKLQINAGIVADGFTPNTATYGNIIGATSGGLTFNPNPEYEDFGEDVDNVPANTWQLKRIKSYNPQLSGTFVTITAVLAAALSGAGGFASGDTTHFVPNHVLVAADFKDIWFIGDYSAINENGSGKTAGFVAIHLKHAMNTTGFQLTTKKDGKGNFPFEYHGHYDLDNPDEVPFEIYVAEGSATLASLTVTSAAGTAVGDSKITVSGYSLGTGERYVYKTAAGTAPSVEYGDDVSTWTVFDSGDDITPGVSDTKITVAVMDAFSRAVGAGDATITKKTN